MGVLWAGTPSPSPNLHHNPKGLGGWEKIMELQTKGISTRMPERDFLVPLRGNNLQVVEGV